MGARDVAGDGQSESGAALILIARIIEPQERFEYLFAQMRCDAGTVVIDGDGQPPVVPMAGDRDRPCMACRIGHEIGETALERRRPDRDDGMAMKGHAGSVAVAL